jgi:hypothetical protein
MRAIFAAALVLLAVAAGEARAQAKRDVQIESDPPGADVYLNSKDDGSLCKTPCSIKAPIGEQIVIVELADHVSLIESIEVPRRGKPATRRFKLQRALGTIVVKGPEGARIRIGDADKGKAPAKLEVDAGPHTITLTLNNKQVLQDLVEVEAGQEVVVRGKDVAAAGGGGGSSDGGDGDGDDVVVNDAGEDGSGGSGGSGGETGGSVTQKAPAPRSPDDKLFAVTGLIDIGFRSFTYQNAQVDDDPATVDELSDENEGGQVIAGPMVEVWPGTIAGVRALRGLAVMARMQFPINKQPVTGGRLMGMTTTFWQSFEISARHRWTIRSKGTIEASFGFVRDEHRFNTSPSNLNLVPDADYRSIKLGARGSLLVGSIEPYLALENRVVISGGDVIEERFSRADASGLRGALGAGTQLGPLHARLEASFTRYSWTFKYDTTDTFKADGASDSITLISAAVGYAY